MQSSSRSPASPAVRAVLRRALPIAVLACLGGAVIATPSCADDSARVGGSGGIEPPARPVGATAAEPPREAGAPQATFDVNGRVIDDLDEAVAGRPVVVVDARGERHELVTDEDGGFLAAGIVAPYDLLVAQAHAGSVITPLVFLGLRRADPRIEVFERQGPTDRPAAQPIRLGVKLPPCRARAGSCWVSIVSASKTGSGGTAGSYAAGAQASVFDLDHAWREPATRPGETIDVHVLTGNADYTEYAYAHLPHIAARPGEPTELGMIEPVAVASSNAVTVAGQATGLPDGWQWTLASQLELPGGALVALRYDAASSVAMRLPKLPGASWHVGAWAQHPPTPERPYFHRSSQAWSGSLPLTATTVALDVPLAPATSRPLLEGSLSGRGPGLAWDGGVAALASLVVVDTQRGEQRFRAFTADVEIPLARLQALGLEPLQPGEHVLDLTTTPGGSLDALTEPDEHLRKRGFDLHVPGATTYQRFRFMVTP